MYLLVFSRRSLYSNGLQQRIRFKHEGLIRHLSHTGCNGTGRLGHHTWFSVVSGGGWFVVVVLRIAEINNIDFSNDPIGEEWQFLNGGTRWIPGPILLWTTIGRWSCSTRGRWRIVWHNGREVGRNIPNRVVPKRTHPIRCGNPPTIVHVLVRTRQEKRGFIFLNVFVMLGDTCLNLVVDGHTCDFAVS